ncbi:translation initiation factor eIF-2B alpha/beta/delta subunit family protein, partial [Rubrivivax gelatinosus]
VYDGARTFAVIESVRRNRDPGSLEELIQLEQNAGSEKVADDDRALIRSTLKELTHCNVASSAAVLAWKKANPNGFVFEDRTFKLKGDVCPS